MIDHKLLKNNYFVVCTGETEGIESLTNSNDSGVFFNQYIYAIKGEGKIVFDDSTEILFSERMGLNVKEHKGKSYTATNTSDIPGGFIAINPIDDSKEYDFELIKGPFSGSKKSIEFDRIILCVRGTVKINSSNINYLEYGVLVKNKKMTIDLDDDSDIIILTDKESP